MLAQNQFTYFANFQKADNELQLLVSLAKDTFLGTAHLPMKWKCKHSTNTK